MHARIVAGALLVALAACGDQDDDLEREVRRICDSLQADTSTLRDGLQGFGSRPLFISCRNDLTPLDNQTCASDAAVCQFRWQFLSRDCSPTGGCTFVCDVRTTDAASGGEPPIDTPICGRRFLSGQQFLFL